MKAGRTAQAPTTAGERGVAGAQWACGAQAGEQPVTAKALMTRYTVWMADDFVDAGHFLSQRLVPRWMPRAPGRGGRRRRPHTVPLVAGTARGYASRARRPPRRTPELYKVLGVSVDASPQEIKDSFLAQVKLHHPDINPGEGAAERFDLIQSAMNLLGDLPSRREYDAANLGYEQDEWVYGEEAEKEEAKPLGAMTEAELQRKAAWLEERLRVIGVVDLGEQGKRVNAGGGGARKLLAEVEQLSEQRQAVRLYLAEMQKAKLRRGGNRGRKKSAVRTSGTEWWDVPDNPTHYERMHGGGRRAAKQSTEWDPYLKGEASTVPEKSRIQQQRQAQRK